MRPHVKSRYSPGAGTVRTAARVASLIASGTPAAASRAAFPAWSSCWCVTAAPRASGAPAPAVAAR
jgi:hypothetical protein